MCSEIPKTMIVDMNLNYGDCVSGQIQPTRVMWNAKIWLAGCSNFSRFHKIILKFRLLINCKFLALFVSFNSAWSVCWGLSINVWYQKNSNFTSKLWSNSTCLCNVEFSTASTVFIITITSSARRTFHINDQKVKKTS